MGCRNLALYYCLNTSSNEAVIPFLIGQQLSDAHDTVSRYCVRIINCCRYAFLTAGYAGNVESKLVCRFIRDTLACTRCFRMFNVVDDFN